MTQWEQVIQVLSILAVAVAGVAIGLKRLQVGWAKSETEVSIERAQSSLINALRDELSRMSAQNLRLLESMNGLQIRVIELTHQITMLTAENHSLIEEVADLRAQVASLTGTTQHDELKQK